MSLDSSDVPTSKMNARGRECDIVQEKVSSSPFWSSKIIFGETPLNLNVLDTALFCEFMYPNPRRFPSASTIEIADLGRPVPYSYGN